MSVSSHRGNRRRPGGKAARQQADREPDQRVGTLGNGDREQDRSGIPAEDLGADKSSRGRIGGQEGAGEELGGTKDQLRDASDKSQMQGKPVAPRPRGEPLGDANPCCGRQKADPADEEGADDIGRAQIASRRGRGLWRQWRAAGPLTWRPRSGNPPDRDHEARSRSAWLSDRASPGRRP